MIAPPRPGSLAGWTGLAAVVLGLAAPLAAVEHEVTLSNGDQLVGEILTITAAELTVRLVRPSSSGGLLIGERRIDRRVVTATRPLTEPTGEYQKRLAYLVDTAEGHADLARWCRDRRLWRETEFHTQRSAELVAGTSQQSAGRLANQVVPGTLSDPLFVARDAVLSASSAVFGLDSSLVTNLDLQSRTQSRIAQMEFDCAWLAGAKHRADLATTAMLAAEAQNRIWREETDFTDAPPDIEPPVNDDTMDRLQRNSTLAVRDARHAVNELNLLRSRISLAKSDLTGLVGRYDRLAGERNLAFAGLVRAAEALRQRTGEIVALPPDHPPTAGDLVVAGLGKRFGAAGGNGAKLPNPSGNTGIPQNGAGKSDSDGDGSSAEGPDRPAADKPARHR
ncbi:hypothetical protein LBMAG53_35800 [Planctomycetota bacterium]|nr:hypothetical protein LBMAG53_35800 [Planctomycetota bacterium]